MSKWLMLGTFFLFGLLAAPAMAQDGGSTAGMLGQLSGSTGLAGVGAGLTILGAAIGIGRIGGSACESIARQPDMAARVQTAGIIFAALIEGAAFFALLICFLTS